MTTGDVVRISGDPRPRSGRRRARSRDRDRRRLRGRRCDRREQVAGGGGAPGTGTHGSTLVHGLSRASPTFGTSASPNDPASSTASIEERRGSWSWLERTTPTSTSSTSCRPIPWSGCTPLWCGAHAEHSRGVIDAPIGRSRRDPAPHDRRHRRPAVAHPLRGRPRFDEPVEVSLLTCGSRPVAPTRSASTRRSIGHPVVGDPLYGGQRSSLRIDRPFLHARRLTFVHPGTGEEVTFEVAVADRSESAVLDGCRDASASLRLTRPRTTAAGDVGQVGQRVGLEHRPHLGSDVGPEGEQHALTLVVAGAVGVGLAEVTGLDRAVDGARRSGPTGCPRGHGPARSRRRRHAWIGRDRRP